MTCCDAAAGLDLIKQKPTHGENLKRVSITLDKQRFQSDFTIMDMHCAACIQKLERGFEDLPGIERVRANLSLKRLSIVWDERETSVEKIEETIQKLGFSANPFDLATLSDKEDDQSKQLLIALGVAGFSAMNIMLLSVSIWSGTDAATTHLFHLISGVIAVPAVFFAGKPFFNAAYGALKVGRLNMEVPISLAVLLALGMSVFESLNGGEEAYFDAAVSLLFFLLIGRYLDHLMRRKARHALDQLSHLAAKGAMVFNESDELTYRALDEISPGDLIQINPGDRIPLDCTLMSSNAVFDRSLVTGESMAVHLTKGAEVEAGTLNIDHTITLTVLRTEDQSFVAEIIRLMETAEGSRSKYVRVADRMAQIYAPAVHLLAFVAFVGWLTVTGDWHQAIYTAIAVLIVTCPCALGLAVPVVHVIAATKLFKLGIMMKDGSALERAAEVNTVFFDKTGTLTTGIADTIKVSGDADFIPMAKALAQASSHPKAKAIAAHLNSTLVPKDIGSVSEHTGNGVEAVIGTRIIRLGRPDWVRCINPNITNSSVVCGDNEGNFLAFDIRETLRENSREAIEKLNQRDFAVALISGDQADRVEKSAKEAGIYRYFSDQRPEDKINRIKRTTREGACVLMVGDGLNDVAALCEGHASMAPSNACDIGNAAADFVFTRPSLEAVPQTLSIARRAARLVKQNFALALIYNCIAVPCAMAGLVTPLFAALAMSFSSIVVIANSMRLNFDQARPLLKPDLKPQRQENILT